MNPQTPKSGANPEKRKKAAPALPSFDKLEAVKRLKNAEFGEKQAVTLVETLQDAQNELATKADLEKTELAIRTDMEKMELAIRTDMEKMESAIRADMKGMEAGIRTDMKGMEASTKEMGASIRAEMKEMESSTKEMGASIRIEMKEMGASIRADVEQRLISQNRLFAFGLSIATAVIGIIIALTK